MEKLEIWREDYDWRIKIKGITPKEIRKLIKNSENSGLKRDKIEEKKLNNWAYEGLKKVSKNKIYPLIQKLKTRRDKSIILKNKEEVFQFYYSAKNKSLGGSWRSEKRTGKEFLDKILR
jgi:hypothetical protein